MLLQIKYLKSIYVSALFCFSLQLASAQQIGLELYSMRKQFKKGVPGTLAKIKSWNIKEIEGGGSYGLPKAEYKKLLKKNNLKMVSIGVDFDQLSMHPDSAIYEAKYYGASYIVCFWMPHNGDEFTINDIKKAVTIFNKAGKLFKE